MSHGLMQQRRAKVRPIELRITGRSHNRKFYLLYGRIYDDQRLINLGRFKSW